MFRRKKMNLKQQLLDRNVNYEKRAEAALAIGGLKQATYLEALVYALINDPEPSVRMNSAYALGELSMKAAKEPLMKAMQEDGSEWVRGFCASALADLPVEFGDVEEAMIKMLEKEIDGGAKRHFAHSLGQVGSEKSLKILTSLMMNDLDPGVRADCAEALGTIKSEKSYDILVKTAENDISAEVRRQAFVAYKNIEEAR